MTPMNPLLSVKKVHLKEECIEVALHVIIDRYIEKPNTALSLLPERITNSAVVPISLSLSDPQYN